MQLQTHLKLESPLVLRFLLVLIFPQVMGLFPTTHLLVGILEEMERDRGSLKEQ